MHPENCRHLQSAAPCSSPKQPRQSNESQQSDLPQVTGQQSAVKFRPPFRRLDSKSGPLPTRSAPGASVDKRHIFPVPWSTHWDPPSAAANLEYRSCKHTFKHLHIHRKSKIYSATGNKCPLIYFLYAILSEFYDEYLWRSFSFHVSRKIFVRWPDRPAAKSTYDAPPRLLRPV